MAIPLFLQNTIAFIWDFDETLIPGYMQAPLFEKYEVAGGTFCKEVNALPEFYKKTGNEHVSADTMYLNHILSYVRAGRFSGLTNDILQDLGKELKFFPGMPDLMERLTTRVSDNTEYAKHDISVEHYVVSTGLRQMVLGSKVSPHIKGVWGCEFSEDSARPGFMDSQTAMPTNGREIQEIIYSIDNTTKTRAIFEINKGTNIDPRIDVNSKIPESARRIPFQHMVYIADGPSDVPVFSVLKKSGGHTFAVYEPGVQSKFKKAKDLLDQGRVDGNGPADYTKGSHTTLWLTTILDSIANRIVENREQALKDSVQLPPGHIV